jgi:protein-disulfide isomerase
VKHFAWLLSAFLILTMIFLPAATNAQNNVDFEISKKSFFEEGLAPVRKSGSYDVTIVYFMDYQCPACREYTPDVARVLKEDPRVRVIYRDTPLLGPRSDKAALAAIASSFQGRHEAFHYALMMTKGPLDDSALKAAAKISGVNWSRLERDMIVRRDDIDLLIGRNFELATEIGIAGTPAFIVGERQSNGALDYKSLKLEIADARKELGVGTFPVDQGGSEPEISRTHDGEPQNSASAAQSSTEVSAVSIRKPDLRPANSMAGSDSSGTWKLFAGIIMLMLAFVAIWAAARKKSRHNVTAR